VLAHIISPPSTSGRVTSTPRRGHREAARLRAAGNEPTGLSVLHSAATNLDTMRGDNVAARVEVDLALEFARRSRNPTALASALFSFASATWEEDRAAAVRALDDAIDMAQAGVGGALLGYALARRAVLRADRHDFAGAVKDSARAIHEAGERADRPMLTMTVESAMAVLEAAGRDEAALVLAAFGAVLAASTRRSLRFGMARNLGITERVGRAVANVGVEAERSGAWRALSGRGGRLRDRGLQQCGCGLRTAMGDAEPVSSGLEAAFAPRGPSVLFCMIGEASSTSTSDMRASAQETCTTSSTTRRRRGGACPSTRRRTVGRTGRW
jgi:hypothetical protein